MAGVIRVVCSFVNNRKTSTARPRPPRSAWRSVC